MKVDQNPFAEHTHMLELNNPKVLIRPNQAESAKEKNIIVGEGRSELSKSHQEVPAKKIPEDSLKNSALGGQEKNKGAKSAKTGLTGLETDLTGHSGNSGKILETKKKKKGRVLKESSRSRGDCQTKLRIQSHHHLKSNRV